MQICPVDTIRAYTHSDTAGGGIHCGHSLDDDDFIYMAANWLD